MARHATRYRTRLPGRELAGLGTAVTADGYATISWLWSLRDDGTIWYRLKEARYADPGLRTRREPADWHLVRQLAAPDPSALTPGRAAELLTVAALERGHCPVPDRRARARGNHA